jgi:ABC-type histidine transport system ATPase subunit
MSFTQESHSTMSNDLFEFPDKSYDTKIQEYVDRLCLLLEEGGLTHKDVKYLQELEGHLKYILDRMTDL